MRRLLLLPLLLVLLTPARADVELIRVWPGYRTAESFVGIGEYFGGEEDTAGRIILRSDPEDRGGFYWLVRLRTEQPLENLRIEVAVIRGGRTEPETHRFTASLPAGRPVVLAGLTGRHWPDDGERPVAWRIRILNSAGEEIAAERSFLWSLPAGGQAG